MGLAAEFRDWPMLIADARQRGRHQVTQTGCLSRAAISAHPCTG